MIQLYSYQNGGNMAGRVVPRWGFPASASSNGEGDRDINARLKTKYHMNVSKSIGFFGESSSKIISTSILGEIKLEIVLPLKSLVV